AFGHTKCLLSGLDEPLRAVVPGGATVSGDLVSRPPKRTRTDRVLWAPLVPFAWRPSSQLGHGCSSRRDRLRRARERAEGREEGLIRTQRIPRSGYSVVSTNSRWTGLGRPSGIPRQVAGRSKPASRAERMGPTPRA